MEYSWWNLIPQHMSPTAVELFGFPVRWYGLMYLAAFFTCYQVIWHFIRKDKLPISKEQLDGLATWVIAGILIGARLGYVVFYNLPYYAQHPLESVLPFSLENGFRFTGISGMSYHGGLIGAFLSGSYYIRREKLDYWMATNLTFLAVPLGYTFGRLGNFINGELYGRPTDSPIGMLFPMDHTQQLRHPSQLYEMLFEGVILFFVLVGLRRIGKLRHHMMALYLVGYGSVRFVIEFFREPDAQIGLNSIGASRGQLLCAAMIIAGGALYFWRRNRVS